MSVCNTRNIKDGGVVLSCENSSDTMKVKQIVEASYGKNYDVRLPEVKKPRVRITNISDQIDEDKLIDEIKKMNADLKEVDMKLVTVINRKKYSNTYRDIIVEVNGYAYKKLLKMGTIFLDWRQCQITETRTFNVVSSVVVFHTSPPNVKLNPRDARNVQVHIVLKIAVKKLLNALTALKLLTNMELISMQIIMPGAKTAKFFNVKLKR